MDSRKRLLSYAAISTADGSLVLRFAGAGQIQRSPLFFLAALFVGPAVLGFILGLNIQKDLVRSALRRLGPFTVHPVPAAWDWKLAEPAEEQWVFVTLKVGREYTGFSGKDSFASSNPDERDLVIQWFYDNDDNGYWTAPGTKSVPIAASEISTVEFLPYASEEGGNDQIQFKGETDPEWIPTQGRSRFAQLSSQQHTGPAQQRSKERHAFRFSFKTCRFARIRRRAKKDPPSQIELIPGGSRPFPPACCCIICLFPALVRVASVRALHEQLP